MKKVKDDDIIISCDKKYTCYEHLHANECLMAYRKECKLSDKYKQALEEIKNEIGDLKDINKLINLQKILDKINEVLNEQK